MTSVRTRLWRRRWPIALVGSVAVVVYVVVVLLYAGGLRAASDQCATVVAGDPAAGGDDVVEVKLQPAAVNAVGQRLQFQLTLEPPKSLLADDGYTARQRLSLLTFPVDGTSVLTFDKGEVFDSSVQSDYAEGIVEEWPFDSYRADLTTVAFTGEGDDRVAVPTTVCLDDTVPGWQLRATTVQDKANVVTTATKTVPLPSVVITATRSASTVAFGIVLLGLMAAIPVLVLFVAISAFIGRRKVEATLTSWIGAMLFAIIPLRTFLPGSPPVGSWIDYVVVLWVIVGLVTGLTIYILAWNRWGSRARPRGLRQSTEQPRNARRNPVRLGQPRLRRRSFSKRRP